MWHYIKCLKSTAMRGKRSHSLRRPNWHWEDVTVAGTLAVIYAIVLLVVLEYGGIGVAFGVATILITPLLAQAVLADRSPLAKVLTNAAIVVAGALFALVSIRLGIPFWTGFGLVALMTAGLFLLWRIRSEHIRPKNNSGS